LICAAAFAISLWANAGFEAKFKTFLFLGAYLIAPFGAILLLDYFIGGRKDKSRIGELYDESRILNWGFVAWLGGAAASVPFWQLSFFTGPLASSHPQWGDESYFVGFAVGAVLYLLTYRLKPLWRRQRRTLAQASASQQMPSPAPSVEAQATPRHEMAATMPPAQARGEGTR
jgi:purine-cytosine permease-like protein